MRVTALWLAQADISVGQSEAALQLVRAAAGAASARWRRVYDAPVRIRIVAPADQPVPQTLRAAIAASGCDFCEVAAGAAHLAAQSDLAIIAAPSQLSEIGLTPALIWAPGGEPAMAFDRGGADPLSGARRAGLPTTPASATAIAEAILTARRNAANACVFGDYLAEDDAKRVGRRDYDLLVRLVGGRSARSNDAPEANDGWARARALAQGARPGALDAIEALCAAYGRADRLAVAYGERWRSTLVSRSFLLALASVVSGLIGILVASAWVITIPIQLVVTGLLFVDRRHAARQRWRDKWLDYRRLAETLRIARFLALAGVARDTARAGDWTGWAALEAARSASPVDELSDAAAPDVLSHLAACEIAEQVSYHRDAFRRFRRLDLRIDRAATVVLIAMIALGLIFAAMAVFTHGSVAVSLNAAISLALSAAPSLQATVNGVRRDLDVARQAKRSAAIARELKRLAQAVSKAPATAATARLATMRAAEIMSEDVSQWRRVVSVI